MGRRFGAGVHVRNESRVKGGPSFQVPAADAAASSSILAIILSRGCALPMIVILDFGAPYNQLIVRCLREAGVAASILPYNATVERIGAENPSGIILSGGPASVTAHDAPRIPAATLDLNLPILGICYGMQELAQTYGGVVKRHKTREYSQEKLKNIVTSDPLAATLAGDPTVWMSHGDTVVATPNTWQILAATDSCPVAMMGHPRQPWWGIQFHPEVAHTPRGKELLREFALSICASPKDWALDTWLAGSLAGISEYVGDRRVVAAVSGGVDSTVMAVLLHRALGDRLRCVFVDSGLLRANEPQSVPTSLMELGLHVETAVADDRFLAALRHVVDPDEKRRRIARLFWSVLRDSVGPDDLLAQGTLYPDIIESVATVGPSLKPRTHHSRDEDILDLIKQGRVLEPLRELFKDEVRVLGKELGVPARLLSALPFPGPGLAVRVIGEVTQERLELVRAADRIVMEELDKAALPESLAPWQAFAVLAPVESSSYLAESRWPGRIIGIRAVRSIDGMTADWSPLPHELLGRMSHRIMSELSGVTRVVYDITSKPPATIEWE